MMLGVIMLVSLLTRSLSHAFEYKSNYYSVAKEVINWKKNSLDIPSNKDLLSERSLIYAGTASIDWYAISLGRLGLSDSFKPYLDKVERNIITRYQAEGQLDRVRATEWHRTGLAILSCGGDPTRLKDGEINLVEDGSYNRGKKMALGAQGDNALFWGLILMDGMRYKIPETAVDTREKIIQSILGKQKLDGGFAFGNISSPDATGMALQALAPYYNIDGAIRVAIDQAVCYLSNIQQQNGRFLTNGEESCESLVQAIIGLCSLGINPEKDSRFVKNGHSLVEAFLTFQQPDRGFGHLSNQGRSDSMASEQALLALTALIRFDLRLRNLYDFRKEPDSSMKEMIRKLDIEIEQLKGKPENEKIEQLYLKYQEIPIQERSYVRNYGELLEAMNELNLTKSDENFWSSMNQNSSGAGTVIRIQDGTEIVINKHVSVSEKRKWNVTRRVLVMGLSFLLFILIIVLNKIRKHKQTREND